MAVEIIFDGVWFDGNVESVSSQGVTVHYTEAGDSEEIPNSEVATRVRQKAGALRGSALAAPTAPVGGVLSIGQCHMLRVCAVRCRDVCCALWGRREAFADGDSALQNRQAWLSR